MSHNIDRKIVITFTSELSDDAVSMVIHTIAVALKQWESLDKVKIWREL